VATTQKLQKLMTKQKIKSYQVKTVQNFSQNLKPHIQIRPTSKNEDLLSTACGNVKTSKRKC